jgi:RbsD / FucU transport protein family
MKKAAWQILCILMVAAFVCVIPAHGGTPSTSQTNWQAKLNEMLPLLGHRNWILIVDSAYPLQTSPGVQTVETGASDLAVVKDVLNAIDHSIHVRPIVYMDAELPFVPERNAPGITEYRRKIKAILGDRPVNFLPHDQLIHKVEAVGKTFEILILKTNLTIPYTSVFLQLDCKYWSADAEARLRNAMKQAAVSPK